MVVVEEGQRWGWWWRRRRRRGTGGAQLHKCTLGVKGGGKTPHWHYHCCHWERVALTAAAAVAVAAEGKTHLEYHQ